MPSKRKHTNFAGGNVVAGKREGNEKRLPVERKEELATVRMIVRMPEQDALRGARVRVIRAARLLAVREDVVATDGFVAAIENVTFPLADERARGRAALVAGVEVHRARTLRRPAHDFDLALRGIVDQVAIVFESGRCRIDHGHRHPREVRRKVGVEIVEHRHGD